MLCIFAFSGFWCGIGSRSSDWRWHDSGFLKYGDEEERLADTHIWPTVNNFEMARPAHLSFLEQVDCDLRFFKMDIRLWSYARRA